MSIDGRRVGATRQKLPQVLSQVDVQSAAYSVEVELLEHEVAGELQAFGSVQAAGFDPDNCLLLFVVPQNSQGVDDSLMIETAIRHAGMQRVAKQVIDPVYTEWIAGHDLRHQLFPFRERLAAPLLRTYGDFCNVVCVEGRRHRVPQLLHLWRPDHFDGEVLVMRVLRQQFLGAVGKWDVPEVVTKCRHPHYRTPVTMLRIGRVGRRKDLLETPGAPAVLRVRQDVEDSAGEIHDSETMLEALVRGPRVDEPGEGELVNVTKPLKRP